MTNEEIEIAKGLKGVNTGLNINQSKFLQGMAYRAEMSPQSTITPKQREYLFGLVYSYRGQAPELYNKYQNHELCQKRKS